MSDPDRDVGSGDPKVRNDRDITDLKALGEQLQQWHQCQLQWHNLQSKDSKEQGVAAPEVKPSKRIGREDGQGDREDNRWQSNS